MPLSDEEVPNPANYEQNGVGLTAMIRDARKVEREKKNRPAPSVAPEPPKEIWEKINECTLEIDTYCFAERLMQAGERQTHIKHILQTYFDPVAHSPAPDAQPSPREALLKLCSKNMGNDLLVIPCDLPSNHSGPCERNTWPVNEASHAAGGVAQEEADLKAFEEWAAMDIGADSFDRRKQFRAWQAALAHSRGRIDELAAAVEAVTRFDWSGNDEDAVQAIDRLRAALAHRDGGGK